MDYIAFNSLFIYSTHPLWLVQMHANIIIPHSVCLYENPACSGNCAWDVSMHTCIMVIAVHWNNKNQLLVQTTFGNVKTIGSEEICRKSFCLTLCVKFTDLQSGVYPEI
ncbi:hypothetical protein GDO86_008328 [Hymenochirus boettgeri]|uniref:Uncharacterized protein n=1 Tax=Hymenochirus boettgeri TaxID=247094 RepID=A0A8T2J2C5_9PIPI|nr:hypothetical protein GDO86_008328 [Hymenochirus boettgeri]